MTNQKNQSEQKTLWIAGGGIAGMAVAAFAIRDAGVAAENIHIIEETNISGGSLDGGAAPVGANAWVTRGGRMLTDETYLCLWNLFGSIPSLENPQISVRQEVIDFNKEYKTDAHARLIDENHNIINAKELGFSNQDRLDMLKLMSLSEELLGSKRIDEFFSEHFFSTNFWKMWRTTFAFQKWHSLVELRRYFIRFIQEFPRIHSLAGVRRTKYNQYDSLVVPLQKWLLSKGVKVHFGSKVIDAEFDDQNDEDRRCRSFILETKEKKEKIVLDKNDYMFLTLGSITSDTRFGTNSTIPELIRDRQDGGWQLWENISKKASDFGRPMSFYGNVDEHKWESFTLTMNDEVLLNRIVKYSNNKPGTGALMTLFNSNWHLSIVVPRQPHFVQMPENQFTIWGYGFQIDEVGNYVSKKMCEATGDEILTELIKQLGFDDILEHALKTTTVTTVMMPYASALFACRANTDRPLVVPKNSKNFAFLGQFVEIPNDVVFTVEYSVRAAMLGVYKLFNVDKKIPAIYNGMRDPKVALAAVKTMFR